MPDTLVPLKLSPGLYRNGTTYQAKSRWYDANLVRFSDATIKPVGGWRFIQSDSGTPLDALTGIPRGVISLRGAGSGIFIGLATTEKLYILVAGVMYDVTPSGFLTTGAVDSGGVAGSAGSYGAGAYGSGAYGEGSSTASILEAASWQLDSFGNSIVGVDTKNLKLYVWDGVVTDIATVAAGSPSEVHGVFVTPERFVVVLRREGNVRELAWARQETTTDWDFSSVTDNAAGTFELTTEGRLMCGRRMVSESGIWTDTDMHTMRYIGGTYVYQFKQAGDKCGAISPRSPVVIDSVAMWMGRHNFFMYDGFVKPIPCEVRDYVFDDFNDAQRIKVWGTSVAEHGEVWWFYPSSASNECDRYVAYNYRENHWNTGRIRRSAGCDASALASPIMLAPTGEVFEHEVATTSRPSVPGEEGGVSILTESGIPITSETGSSIVVTEQLVPYLESGPVEIGDGNRMMSVQRVISDEKQLGDVQLTMYSALFPTDDETMHGPFTMDTPTDVRINARQVRVRLEQDQKTDWRVGVIRLGARQSSAR